MLLCSTPRVSKEFTKFLSSHILPLQIKLDLQWQEAVIGMDSTNIFFQNSRIMNVNALNDISSQEGTMNATCDEFQALSKTSKTTSKVKDCCEQLNSESLQTLAITEASKTRSRTFTLSPQSSSCTTQVSNVLAKVFAT